MNKYTPAVVFKLPATSAVNRRETEFLFNESSKLQGEEPVIVEIGSCTGRSTAALAAGNPRARVHSVDCWTLGSDELMSMSILEEVFHANMKFMEFGDRVVVHRGFSVEEAKIAAEQGTNQIDLLFIDGDHSYEGALNDLKAWVPLVKENGLICLHDYDRTETVVKAIKDFFGKNFRKGKVTQRIFHIRK